MSILEPGVFQDGGMAMENVGDYRIFLQLMCFQAGSLENQEFRLGIGLAIENCGH